MPGPTTLPLGEREFLHIKQGRGVTIAFTDEAEDIPASVYLGNGPGTVGTLWCSTCIAVYFPLDRKRCFFGHFNAYT